VKDQRRLDAEREAALADQKRTAEAEEQKKAATAQKRIADARKRTAQVALSGLVIALLVAGVAFWQFLQATGARKDALMQRDVAVRAQDAATIAEKEALIQRDRAVQAEAVAEKGTARRSGQRRAGKDLFA
jgi:hypothetical protein